MSQFLINPATGEPLAADEQEMMNLFKEQLLIAFVRRMVDKHGEFRLPATEVDETGQFYMELAAEDGDFIFTLRDKS